MVALRRSRRRLLAPEVVQTSAMDCGPASLKSLLEGHGIHVSYGRLREACQTDVDGTSIDTLEDVAVQLGLDAQQVIVPVDHVLLPEARALPAIAVVRLPTGANHFVVAWQSVGGVVQLMDPATGRRWPLKSRFLEELYQHSYPVPVRAWRAWAGTEEFLGPLRTRIRNLGIGRRATARLIAEALDDTGWEGLGSLDAAARMVDSMVRSQGIRRGRQALGVLKALKQQALVRDEEDRLTVPAAFWSVYPAHPSPDGEPQVVMRGAVLVRVRQRRPVHAAKKMQSDVDDGGQGKADGSAAVSGQALSPELAAALREPPAKPGRDLLRMMMEDGMLAPSAITGALALSAIIVLLEALLFRGLLDVGRHLGLFEQRVGAIAMLLLFGFAAMLLELPIATNMVRFGRKLETRMRMAFLRKIPRLGDRYFQSRLTSDMAERSHAVQAIRGLPTLAFTLLRASFALLFTTAGIIWLDPASLPVAISAAVLAVAVPLCCLPFLGERNMRVRTHAGALSRFYLDALLGLVAVRTHGAERSVRREHEGLLAEWMRASLSLQRAVVSIEAVQLVFSFGLAAWLLMDHFGRAGEAASVLLLIYWALSLPAHGQEIATLARQYPNLRNVALRIMEPLGAPEGDSDDASADERRKQHAGSAADETRLPSSLKLTSNADAAASLDGHPHSNLATRAAALQQNVRHEITADAARAVSIEMRNVSVRAAGRLILSDVSLDIQPGEHVGIVGPSGAGKSTFVGLLLGWHRAAEGSVRVDGRILDQEHLRELRQVTAWVDPSVQLWNRSLLENLRYGAEDDALARIGMVITQAQLQRMVSELPHGLQTTLGEGGALVSGGEGQRVRLARAMLRSQSRLAILDEPFRGLDRQRRSELLQRARELWRNATVLCITHDVEQTMSFDRVLVVDSGRIIEAGRPTELAQRSDSAYRQLLDAERNVRAAMWTGAHWRRLWLEGGELQERVEQQEQRTGGKVHG